MNLPVFGDKPVILAVDDNLDNLVLLEYQLEGCITSTIVTATTGNSAFLSAMRLQPDLILLDVLLPDIDGIEVVRRLRRCPLTAAIPTIAVTALARGEDRDRILAAGFDAYLSKPYDIDDLEALVTHHLPQRCLL